MANKMTAYQLEQMCENAKSLGFRPDRLRLLDERLTAWSKSEDTPSIAVKVLRHGQVAFEGAYGILGPDKGPDSLTVDTIFPVCSITKPVVGALLLLMQEEGLVDLTHPVKQYLPEFTGDADGSIRIWHLLTHTSGMNDADLNAYFGHYVTDTLGLTLPKDEDSEEESTALCLKIREKMGLPFMEPGHAMRHATYNAVIYTAPPARKPQEVMSYCNTGYQMAMEIITRLSGRQIDEYAGEKLFAPLKMVDSHFVFPREKLPRFVTRGDQYVGSDWLNEHILDSESGSGGLKTTVTDITRFGQMILNQGTLDGVRVLSPASIREMTTNHNASLASVEFNGVMQDVSWGAWGFGWNLRGSKKDDTGILRSPRSFEHGGFGGTRVLCDPEGDVVVASFMVTKIDNYLNLSHINNIVIGAIDEA